MHFMNKKKSLMVRSKLRKGSSFLLLLGCYICGFLTCYVSLDHIYFNPLLIDTNNDPPAAISAVKDAQSSPAVERRAGGMILPFERTELREYIPGHFSDAYTYFHHYLHHFDKTSPLAPTDFQDLPLLHIWPNYFEAYHNHWQRYRGKKVTFMEIGVQSGGKIPLLRNYFGSGFTYVGIDINPSTKMFDGEDWINIEIGNSEDPAFWKEMRAKYPKVDLFLDDGGHTMNQQRVAIEEMLPHVQSDGVYMCEDLNTSWSTKFGGYEFQDSRTKVFMRDTMVGLVHRSLDWLNAAWIPGNPAKDSINDPKLENFWPEDRWWKEFASSVKHIHYYNQVVVYEKGLVGKFFPTKTVGRSIPYKASGKHTKVDWSNVMRRLKAEFAKTEL
eukprot:CAMPEP_0194299762 /NCGR_PEP_ID=MMETSP0169-20130528/60885_1 /TAXON_ID=218684 /ORGANISM="Corethron pennatum, Strain L29A3" /LENGTH=384 /DNA_ID=CAMNT_0039049873 /DNA_START=450 /DNA_END=1604 /DNA_ORIENTATION=-